MDSGLGSDDERKHRTKEQKQQQNQQKQLFSSCFIDASTLGDDSDHDFAVNDERSQGSLIFQNSIRQYSMLQMDRPAPLNLYCGVAPSALEVNIQNEPSTPHNSIVQVENENVDVNVRTPIGFFVDLSDVKEPSSSSMETQERQKKLFSLVIDFEEPKREMPSKLCDSLYNRNKIKKKATKQEKKHSTKPPNNDLNEKQSPCHSSDENHTPNPHIESLKENSNEKNKTVDKSMPYINIQSRLEEQQPTCSYSSNPQSSSSSSRTPTNSSSNKSQSSNTDNGSRKNSSGQNGFEINKSSDNNEVQSEYNDILNETCENLNEHVGVKKEYNPSKKNGKRIKDEKTETNGLQNKQFVKLSDLQKQSPRLDLTVQTRMSHSIPESSWVESPLTLSRSATYRSAPPRPLEPEPYELSDSSSLTDMSISQTTGRSVQRLGTDLLRMFLEEIGPDVVIEVGTHRLKAHKCILTSRCQYFAAVLGGNWLESTGNVISLQGYSYDSVHFAMCHIYSGAAHVPNSINLVELAALADMLGLEGLKEVVAHALKIRYCHSFHKPCSGCTTGVLEILPLSAAYGLEELYHKCLRWITQHFVRVWPTKAFISLSKDLQEKCYKQHVIHMNPDTVLDTIFNCEKLAAVVPTTRWAEPIMQLVKQLSMSCQLYLSQHFCEVLSSSAILNLNSQFLSESLIPLEEKLTDAIKTLGPDHACHSYERCFKLLEQNWNPRFQELLQKVQFQLEHCLSRQMSHVTQCKAWLKMNPALKVRIKELSRLPRPISTHRAMSLHNYRSESRGSPDHSRIIRESSPDFSYRKLTNSINTSLRRSLLLAAKTPQMTASIHISKRSSTLTKPTQSSAAKAAKSVNTKPSSSSLSYRSTTATKPVSNVQKIKDENKAFSRSADRLSIKSLPQERVISSKSNKNVGSQSLYSKSPAKVSVSKTQSQSSRTKPDTKVQTRSVSLVRPSVYVSKPKQSSVQSADNSFQPLKSTQMTKNTFTPKKEISKTSPKTSQKGVPVTRNTEKKMTSQKSAQSTVSVKNVFDKKRSNSYNSYYKNGNVIRPKGDATTFSQRTNKSEPNVILKELELLNNDLESSNEGNTTYTVQMSNSSETITDEVQVSSIDLESNGSQSISRITRSDTFLKEKPTVLTREIIS